VIAIGTLHVVVYHGLRQIFVVNVAESFLRSDKPSAVSEEESD